MHFPQIDKVKDRLFSDERLCVVTLNGDRGCSRHRVRMNGWDSQFSPIYRVLFNMYIEFQLRSVLNFVDPTYNPLRWSLYVPLREGFCEREHDQQVNTGSAISPSLDLLVLRYCCHASSILQETTCIYHYTFLVTRVAL